MQLINDYLKLKRTKNTKTGISVSLKKFLNWRYNTDLTEISELEKLATQYLQEYQFQDILHYIVWLRDDCRYQPKTISNYTLLVIGFLEYYDVNISKAQRTKMMSAMPRAVAVTQDKPFTQTIIQTMCAHSDVLLNSIILLATSSGMRLGEVLKLELSEIEWGEPNKIHLPRYKMKQGKPHTYRFSTEAADALREWLKVRDNYEKRGITRARLNLGKEKERQSSLVFPMTTTPIYQRWRKMLTDAGLDERDRETGVFLYGTHGCRRWFSSTASKHLQHEISEALIGHDTGLSASYRRYPEEDLDKEYLKLEPFLLIRAPKDYTNIQGSMSTALNNQMKTTAQLTTSVLTMSERLRVMELYIRAIKG